MGIGGRLGNALRALKGHAQPCQTCRKDAARLRSDIHDLQTWAVEWDERLTETLEKARATYARMRGRDKKLREEIVEKVLGHLETGAEIYSPDAEGAGAVPQGANGNPTPEQRKQMLRQRARERGLMR